MSKIIFIIQEQFIILFFLKDEQLSQKSCFDNFKFGGTLFSKIMSNFRWPHTILCQFKTHSNLLERHSFFNKIKLILYPQGRNSMT